MAERGTISPRGAEVAALAIRKAKDYAVDAHVLRASWCSSIGSSIGTAQGSLDHPQARVGTGTVDSLTMTLTAFSSGTSAVRPIVNRALVS